MQPFGCTLTSQRELRSRSPETNHRRRVHVQARLHLNFKYMEVTTDAGIN
jgi:hypothetical protein